MDITKHIEKAEEAARRKNFDGAIALYHQLLDLHPDSARARGGLRDVLLKRWQRHKTSKITALVMGAVPLLSAALGRLLRQHRAVARGLERYLVHDPLNPRRNLQLGDALERAGYKESAIAVFEFSGQADAGSATAWKRAGALLREKGEVARALDAFERALAIAPRDQEALKQRKNLAAEGALQAGGYEEAGSSRTLIKDQDEARSLERATRRHLSAEQIEEEIEHLEEQLARDPHDPRILERLGQLREQKGELESALDLYELALEYQPDSAELRSRVSKLRIASFDGRLEELRRRCDDGDDSARAELESLERERFEFELRECAEGVELHPTDMPLRLRLGRLFIQAGRTDEAIAELQRSVNDPRCRIDSLVALGQCFFKKNMLDLARKQLEKALESLPGMGARSKEILYNLGIIAEKMGALEEARSWFGRIYETDINYRDVARRMERLEHH